MTKWRRRARRRERERAARGAAEAESRQREGETPPAVERVSKYSIREDAVKENPPQPPDDVQGMSRFVAPDEAAKPTGTREATGLTTVGEEVQEVLSSAHDAAAKIRRKAEEDAERIRHDARSAAQAEVAEATRVAAEHRDQAEHIRAEAEAFAAEAKAAAEAFADELRSSAEREAARMKQEVEDRLRGADAEAAQRVDRAEAEARERFSVLHHEINRHEERLESILVILCGMTSQVEALLARRDASDETDQTSDESLEDALRLDRSPAAAEVPAPDAPLAQ